MKNEVILNNNNLQINDLLERYLKYIDVSDNTTKTYNVGLKQFIQYLHDNNIKTPTREDIINFREYLKEEHKPNTINAYLIAVRNFYSWLEYEDITKDISKKIKGIKLENHHIMLKVLGKARDGLKQDSVKIDDRIFELIKEYCKEYNVQDYLFYSTSNNNKGGKMSTKCLREIITNLFKRANLDMERLSAHSTRHTSCELALESGIPLQEVSEYMRHKNISTTLTYVKELNQRNSVIANTLGNYVF